MATLAQPTISSPNPQTTAAEDALFEAFSGLLETLPPDKRKVVLADLRANAEAHGE
jgi:hypothetical protein